MIRRLLALLAVNAGRSVPFPDMVRELWESSPPATWQTTIQTYVLRIRQGLDLAWSGVGPAARGVVVTRPNGYALAVPPLDVDANRFAHFVDQSTREYRGGLMLAAQDTLRAAWSLWRGQCLVDVDPGPLLTIWADGVREKRRDAVSLRFEIDLRLGRHRDVLSELRAEWRADPAFEPTAALLMIALYRSDRQRDALEVLRVTRETLSDEYGLEPGSRLKQLQQQILRGDPKLDLNGDVA